MTSTPCTTILFIFFIKFHFLVCTSLQLLQQPRTIGKNTFACIHYCYHCNRCFVYINIAFLAFLRSFYRVFQFFCYSHLFEFFMFSNSGLFWKTRIRHVKTAFSWKLYEKHLDLMEEPRQFITRYNNDLNLIHHEWFGNILLKKMIAGQMKRDMGKWREKREKNIWRNTRKCKVHSSQIYAACFICIVCIYPPVIWYTIKPCVRNSIALLATSVCMFDVYTANERLMTSFLGFWQ